MHLPPTSKLCTYMDPVSPPPEYSLPNLCQGLLSSVGWFSLHFVTAQNANNKFWKVEKEPTRQRSSRKVLLVVSIGTILVLYCASSYSFATALCENERGATK